MANAARAEMKGLFRSGSGGWM